MPRRALLLLSFLLLLFTAGLVVTGGFTTSVLGLRVSAHSPGVALTAALLVLVVWAVAARRAHAVAQDLCGVDAWIVARADWIVLVIAALAGALAVRFGTFSAAGSDPSGYFSEAVMLSQGALSRVEPLARVATWPDGAATLAPLGWRALGPDLQVPTYAVGLPLLMVVPHLLGGALGGLLLVSATFVAAIWFAGRLASALGGPLAGILAAVWLGTAPIAMYEALQPMSDVPVTAAWLACWWGISVGGRMSAVGGRAREKGDRPLFPTRLRKKGTVPFFVPFLAGTAAAIAVLIRPNLAPLAAVPALFLLVRTRDLAHVVAFSVPVALAGAAVAYLQWRWFGSPFRSGYGTADEIYAFANVTPNAVRYLRWLLETQGPWLLAAPVVLFWPRSESRDHRQGESRDRGALRWMLAFAALICLAYFLYAVFEDWGYLRFLLPAIALAIVAVSVVLASAVHLLPAPIRAPIFCAVVLGLGAWQISTSRDHGVFRLAGQQAGVRQAGRYLSSCLPSSAVIVTGEQSGAMRYYTNRSIVRWDLLPPATLDAVAEELARNGRDIWIVLDGWEEEGFRAKFRGTPAAALDWPPAAEAGREPRTRAWRVRDREGFFRGENVITDRLR